MNLTDKLSDEVLQRRVFNPYYYDLHTKEFLIGKPKTTFLKIVMY